MRLLLVEDDGMVGESVRTGLRREGFTVDWVKNGFAAELAAANDDYALILLDLGLPRKDGIDVLKTLRRKGGHVPILILTARDAVPDRVLGLNSGADDYLVKPFDLHELFARVHALLRRQAGRADPLVRFADVVLNPITHQVTRGGREIDLSATEFALLEALLERPGAILSRSQLEQRLYGWNEEVESNSVEVHVSRLRKKIGADLIGTVRGVGYRMVKPA